LGVGKSQISGASMLAIAQNAKQESNL
jgi:hypothetical protein